jgi:ATP-dependent DNA helicase Rep
MALDVATVREDPMAKLKALRAEFAKKAEDSVAKSASLNA